MSDVNNNYYNTNNYQKPISSKNKPEIPFSYFI